MRFKAPGVLISDDELLEIEETGGTDSFTETSRYDASCHQVLIARQPQLLHTVDVPKVMRQNVTDENQHRILGVLGVFRLAFPHLVTIRTDRDELILAALSKQFDQLVRG